MKKLRIGVILSDVNIPVWVARMLEQIRDSSHAKIIVLAFIGASKIEDASTNELSDSCLQQNKAVIDPDNNPWDLCNVRVILPDVPMLRGEPSKWSFLLKHADLDIFLNLSQETMPESILHVTQYGIWSLRSHNKRVTTSTGISWFDLKQNGPLIHCVVEAQRGLSVHIVAQTVMPANRFSFLKNQRSLLWTASSLLPNAIKQLYLNGREQILHVSGNDTQLINE